MPPHRRARCERIGAPAPSAPVAPAAPTAPAIASTVSEASAREIIVETSKVKAVFSNHGAKIVHWILKEYRTDKGEPLDLVPAGAGPDAIRPFTLMVEDQALSAPHQRRAVSRHRQWRACGTDG